MHENTLSGHKIFLFNNKFVENWNKFGYNFQFSFMAENSSYKVILTGLVPVRHNKTFLWEMS